MPSFTVTFNNNGGTGTMSPQTASTPTALTTNTFTFTGYSFSGWNTLANGTGTAYADGASYPFTASTTLYAQWTAVNYTVTFNNNGGTGTMTPQVTNLPAALTTNTFTYYGFTFAGWNTAADGSGTAYADGASYPFSASATLYAQWTPDTWRVLTFDSNSGGKAWGQTGWMYYNDTIDLTLNGFSWFGKIFTGWNTKPDGSGTAYADGASYDAMSASTLYAQWTNTVFFDDNVHTVTS